MVGTQKGKGDHKVKSTKIYIIGISTQVVSLGKVFDGHLILV